MTSSEQSNRNDKVCKDVPPNRKAKIAASQTSRTTFKVLLFCLGATVRLVACRILERLPLVFPLFFL